jgi:hypothetical protein
MIWLLAHSPLSGLFGLHTIFDEELVAQCESPRT